MKGEKKKKKRTVNKVFYVWQSCPSGKEEIQAFLTKTEGVHQLPDKKLTHLTRNVNRSSLNESKRMLFNILKTQEDKMKLASNDKYTVKIL